MKLLTASEFAETHKCDADWVATMRKYSVMVRAFEPGERITYSGYPGYIRRHYGNALYDVSLASGDVCVDSSDLVPQA